MCSQENDLQSCVHSFIYLRHLDCPTVCFFEKWQFGGEIIYTRVQPSGGFSFIFLCFVYYFSSITQQNRHRNISTNDHSTQIKSFQQISLLVLIGELFLHLVEFFFNFLQERVLFSRALAIN